MGLGWMSSCLRQKLLKPCCILMEELPNVHLIKLIILIVIDPMHLQAISVSSWVVKSMTAKQCSVCCDKPSWTLLPQGVCLGLHTPSFYPAYGLLDLPSQGLEKLF